jgi:hypothetical protein
VASPFKTEEAPVYGGERLSRLGAFSPQFPDAEALHKGLAHWNHVRLSPAEPSDGWREELDQEIRMRRIEGAFIEAFRRHVAPLVAEVPQDADGFIAWFEALKDHGPGQWDPLFDWLEGEASLEDLKWFLTQEAAGEAGFDDLVAMTQVKVPDRAKLELARNYWDEGMGPLTRTTAARDHRHARPDAVWRRPLTDPAGLTLAPTIDTTLWQSLCLALTP